MDCRVVVLFDVDSTLVTFEGLDWLAERKGVAKQIISLTRRSMDGELKLEDVFSKKMKLISPTVGDMKDMGIEYVRNKTNAAKSSISKLQLEGFDVGIMTGNFRPAVSILAQDLGVPSELVWANNIFFDQGGNYLGFDERGPLSRSGGKLDLARDIFDNYDYSFFVGDGSTDLEVKEVATKFIGFGGIVVRENVKLGADIYIEEASLDPVYDSILKLINL